MWTYSQTTGYLTDPSGKVVGSGYSGNHQGYNNPTMQAVENIGPCPQGEWIIGQSFTHPLAGPLTMRLSPVMSDQSYGRTGLMIHGDTTAHATDPHPDNSASEGCIVLSRVLRGAIDTSVDRMLQVVP